MLRYGIRLSVAVATFLISLALSATPAPPPSGANAWAGNVSAREVLEANREYLEAHMNGDVAALDRLLADDFTIGRRDGRGSSTKSQRLSMVSDSELTFWYTDRSEPLVTAGENVGKVTGLAVVHGSYMGREFASSPYHYLRKFEKRDGRWQVVSVKVYRAGWE
jgi:hypothetical protein